MLIFAITDVLFRGAAIAAFALLSWFIAAALYARSRANEPLIPVYEMQKRRRTACAVCFTVPCRCASERAAARLMKTL